MKQYVYCPLGGRDLTVFRLGGPGLANCMMLVARAVIQASDLGLPMLRPTWERFGMGPLFRHELDARFYGGMFRKDGLLARLYRFLRVVVMRKKGLVVSGGNTTFDVTLLSLSDLVRKYYRDAICPDAVRRVPLRFKHTIAVHVRRGDFPSSYRDPIEWFEEKVRQACRRLPEANVLVFSDGTDDELAPLLSLPKVSRAHFGNALADMVAMSRCQLLIGSYSTFSFFAAYLGNVPCVFCKPITEQCIVNADCFAIVPMGVDLSEKFVENVFMSFQEERSPVAIPKVVHYCWFGRGKKNALAERCIESWRKYLPEYEIKEWNEDNFDVNSIPYTREAYALKKYAFVSDYARFSVLYRYGGLYFDTDVEIVKPIDDIISNGAFMGLENGNMINAGLGMGAEPGDELYSEIIEAYGRLHYQHADGSVDKKTVVDIVTEVFKKKGFAVGKGPTRFGRTTVYPADYFNPKDIFTGKICLSENTRTIHHFTASWLSPREHFVFWAGNRFGATVGRVCGLLTNNPVVACKHVLRYLKERR